ncbi:MAG TPA: hypothetical protein VM841_15280 [Actinomycetota bacterium]|nr:hypothetical protein [Actinomycetota bacterium]
MLRKIAGALAALSLLMPASGGAVDVPAGPSSDNVRHIRNIPAGTGVGGVFAGTHYYLSAARSGSFLPGGAGTGGILAFDATNARNPVLVGKLPLPHSQNEDLEVSEKRNLLLVVQDRRKSVSAVATSPIIGGILFVIDISNRNQPVLRSTLQLPAQVATRDDGAPLGGPGHTASCIQDCNYAWISGSRDHGVHVVDLRDPSSPAWMGVIKGPAGGNNAIYDPGTVHDVHVDRFGEVWIAGSGGTALYRMTKNPLKPQFIAAVNKRDNERFNGLIHHGALRYTKDLVLVGEEDYENTCGSADGKRQDGSLQVWRIDRKAKRLVPVSSWDVTITDATMRMLAEEVGITCSSHWFDVNKYSIVADGWYEMGVQFIDISKPAKPRHVGWFIGTNSAASQARFHPSDSGVVYVADYNRGLDVIEIDNSGRKAKSVSMSAGAVRAAHAGVRFPLEPDPEFGFACLRRAGV